MFNNAYLLTVVLLAMLGPKAALINQWTDTKSEDLATKADLVIHFENVESEKIKNSFKKVMLRYHELHDCEITLVQGPLSSSTMQAQPIIKLAHIFGQTNKYRVRLALLVRDSKNIKVADLPADVLTGWFAHELGHLVDYRPYNNFQMLIYGFRYLVSGNFKVKVEHAADYIAISHGFRDEIIATKRFILENDLVGDDYKEAIRRYYMPIEDVEIWQHEDVPGSPDTEID